LQGGQLTITNKISGYAYHSIKLSPIREAIKNIPEIFLKEVRFMEKFIERFEKNLREYLKPLEEGKVFYDFSLDRQTLSVLIFTEKSEGLPEYLHGVFMLDVYSEDEDKNRLVSIDNKFFRERTKEPTENILRKFIDVIESDFQVENKKIRRDECYWMVEKGSFIVKRKNAL